jgi:hydroxymethylbilane synthase
MNDQPVLRLGTRGSDLALWQACRIASRLRDEHNVECEIEIIKTSGDRIQNVAFHKMEGKGFFTKELQHALLDHRVDLVVHSLKDLPTESPDGLQVTAVPERGPTGDLLLAPKNTIQPSPEDPFGIPDGEILGTSSLRRAAQTLALRPDLRIKALRGNVPTRIRKLRDGEYGAILLAAAGVHRLQLEIDDLDTRELPADAMLPAPGQGALAIETRVDDPTVEPVARLHDPAVARCVDAERGLLQRLGGGCHLPLGCLATTDATGIRLQAALGDVDQEVTRADVARVAATAENPDEVARACFLGLRLAMPEVVSS